MVVVAVSLQKGSELGIKVEMSEPSILVPVATFEASGVKNAERTDVSTLSRT